MLDWREELGFSPGARPTVEEIDEAYRRKARTCHPDLGGDPDEFHNLTVARDLAKKEMGG